MPKDLAVLIMDQAGWHQAGWHKAGWHKAGWHKAGWHKARALKVQDNIVILYLPPYSPELNPVERLWAYFRSHYLANRVFDDYQHLLDDGAEAWQQLNPTLLRSVCTCSYLTPEFER